jgi:ribosome-binding factor A
MSDLIKDEISRLLLREVRDPRVGFVTITGVSVSPDLRNARVFFSVLGDGDARQASLAALTSASGFFRRSVFKTLRLRHPMTIAFELDESLDQGERIERALRKIHEDEDARVRRDDEGD